MRGNDLLFNKNQNDNEEYELVQITIGQEFPLFENHFENLKDRDGILFEALENENGFTHVIYNKNVRPEEVSVYTNEQVRVRALRSNQGYLLILFKYGNTQVIQEISFDPTLYKDARALQFVEDNNMVFTFCVDSHTNILKGIRMANLPLKLSQLARELWAKAMLVPNYSEGYAAWYQDLQRKYSTKKLWSMGVDVGSLGESFNLEEIKYPYHR